MKELDFKLFIELGKCDIVDTVVSVEITDEAYTKLVALYQLNYPFRECGEIFDQVYAAAEAQLYQDAIDFPDEDEDDDDKYDEDEDDDDEDDDEIYIPPFKVDYPDGLPR